MRTNALDGLYVAEQQPRFATPDALAVNTLGGARAELVLPPTMRLTSRNGHAVYEARAGRLGFQTSAKGLGHHALVIVDHDVTLTGQVDLQGGLLAQYRLNRGNDAVSHFTIWQGTHSDVYTFDYAELETAISGFNLFDIEDTADGAVLRARDVSTALRSDVVTAVASDVVFELFDRAWRPDLLPDWPGGRGAFGEFFVRGVAPEDPMPTEVLFFSGDAVVVAQSIRSDEPVVADRLVERFHTTLSASWRKGAWRR